ncbi:MAG: hypothetical protein IPO62_14245 [Saprospiraceae bacterium]|nr:hypothetical protein [Saprospiraceae bacterium]
MKIQSLILLAIFGGFWLIFAALQNDTIFKNSFCRIAKNYHNENGNIAPGEYSYQSFTEEFFVRWDAKHYASIHQHGYPQATQLESDFIYAFFPLFPLVWKISGLPATGLHFLNYIFFAVSILILSFLFVQKTHRNIYTILACCFPGLVIFLIPYTEALFMICISAAMYGMIKNKYGLYFIFMMLAAMTRPCYIFVIMAFAAAEFYFFLQHKKLIESLKNLSLQALPLLIGTGIVSCIQYASGSGSFFRFLEVQKYWQHVLSIPHNIRDWSAEGFSINYGVLVFLSIPLVIYLFNLYFVQKKKSAELSNLTRAESFIFIASLLYIVQLSAFILLFQGGSLHNLFRYTICTPFFYIALALGYKIIQNIPKSIVINLLAILFLIGFLFYGLTPYSTNWNFSDLGFFILFGSLLWWYLQDQASYLYYKIGLFIILLVNLVWTSYLLNMYLSDAWIFT